MKSVLTQNLFQSAFSCNRTEYGDLRSKSPYSGLIQKNTDQKNFIFGHFSRSGEDTIEKECNASPVSLGIIHLVRTQNFPKKKAFLTS